MKRMMLIAAGLLIAAACTDAVTNPDQSVVPGPQFAKGWTYDPEAVGCTSNTLTPVKYQLMDGTLKVTGTPGNDLVSCTGVSIPITFSGGDGNDIFVGGTKDDQIAGGNGSDWLIGGDGTDHVNGGLDYDTCVGEKLTGCEN